MRRIKKIFKYFSIVVLKLFLLCIAIMLLNLLILLAINNYLDLPLLVPILIAFLPIFSFLFFFFIKMPKTNYIDKLASCKYNPYFPYFYYYSESKKSERIDMKAVTSVIEPCDIVLRRYKRYLDGIIFSENSYFTHVGIYYKNQDEHKILHSTGSLGVHESSLEKFCDCDDIAILRFSLEDTEEESEIRKYIKNDTRATAERPNLKEEEFALYEDLISKTKIKNNIAGEDNLFTGHYRDIVLSRALSLKGAHYDFNFNFEKFGTLSCIEYVWYCFKCLFPFHRIRVKDFEFFNWIVMPIIIPDVFIKNDFFRYVWTSVPKAENKKKLKKIIKKGRKQFWFFLLSIYIWNIIVLVAYYFFRKP